MNGGELRAAMASGKSVWGTMIVFARSLGAARVYGQLGFDYAIVDAEHSPNGRSELADMGASLLSAGVCPIVRVPNTSPYEIPMALDAGFHGVLVPYCETAAQVSALVSAARLRPLKGELEVRARATGQLPSDATRDFLEKRNQDVVVIIGIESVPAVDNLESILDVPGIDAIFIGPGDLSVSLGVPDQYDHPRYVEAVQHVISATQSRGIPAGPHCFDEPMLVDSLKRGARFVLYGADVRALADGYRPTLDRARDRAADVANISI